MNATEQDGDKLVGEGAQLKHPFDPWNIEPSLIVENLDELCGKIV